jgi:hypothetical protein
MAPRFIDPSADEGTTMTEDRPARCVRSRNCSGLLHARAYVAWFVPSTPAESMFMLQEDS